MESYIYECENCLSKDICNEIIELLKKNNSNTMNLEFNYTPYLDSHIKIQEIIHIIDDIITKHIDIYANNIQINNNIIDNPNIIHKPVDTKIIFKNYFQIMKNTYNNLNSKMSYDNFFVNKYFCNKLTYIFYLNDNFDGGETVFIHRSITPKCGKLLIFPTYWNYAYKENNLLRLIDEKYIIKGCLYENQFYVK